MPSIAAENTGTELFASHFEQLEHSEFGRQHAWLMPTRKAAMARFAELGFPTTKHEDWKYTNVSAIANGLWEQGCTEGVAVTPDLFQPYEIPEVATAKLVFVNGSWSEPLSELGGLPGNVTVKSLPAALDSHRELIEEHLAKHQSFDTQPFAALNTAMMVDGAFVHIPKNVTVDVPIQLLYLSIGQQAPFVTHPRNLIIAEPSSQATVIETYAGPTGGAYFTNAVSEVIASENAHVEHYRIIRESDDAHHLSVSNLLQNRDSHVQTLSATLGGSLVRNDINALLDGEGCHSAMNGLYMISGDQHVDNHLFVEHAKPHCDSREFFKGVLFDKSRGIFSGKIYVHEGAQKTDAKQTNQSLLMSDDAQVESKPQLEIFADDVKCTHGATIGQVDRDALFYLRSRGLHKETAMSLLIYAFACECSARIKLEPLRRQIDSLLFKQLPQGDLLKGAI
jgi:Fe-S cluster assembly protein SufD